MKKLTNKAKFLAGQKFKVCPIDQHPESYSFDGIKADYYTFSDIQNIILGEMSDFVSRARILDDRVLVTTDFFGETIEREIEFKDMFFQYNQHEAKS